MNQNNSIPQTVFTSATNIPSSPVSIGRKYKIKDLSLLTDTVSAIQAKRPIVDTSIFDSALSHTRRSDASKKEKKKARPLLNVFACGKVSSPRLYRLNIILFLLIICFNTNILS